MEKINAFEDFQFNIGDLVRHVADTRPTEAARYVVVERKLVETTTGTERRYELTGVGIGSFEVREMEMRSA